MSSNTKDIPPYGTVRITPAFRSSIPARARAVVTHRHASGAPQRVEYYIGRSLVGERGFDEEGALEFDHGSRGGKRHGRTYRLDIPGKLLWASAYKNGLEHGLARQWDDDGRLIGTYRMRHGTGVDLWWQETWEKPRRPVIREVRFMVKGARHGFEWWIDEDQQSVDEERHWSRDLAHGIEREWDRKGKLRHGFPKFFVQGEPVTRRAYEREQRRDPSLPIYRIEDDRPRRTFPPIVARRLSPPPAPARGRRSR